MPPSSSTRNKPRPVENLKEDQKSRGNFETLQHSRKSKMSSVKIEPHENDILMGRGGKNNQWVGNEKLRALAREESENYRMSSKKGKSYISRELVRKIREMDPPGRFLKRQSENGEWVDVGDEVAREKASQVLRDAVSIMINTSTETAEVVQINKGMSKGMDLKPQSEHRRSSSAPPAVGKRNRQQTTRTDEADLRSQRTIEPPQQYVAVRSASLQLQEPVRSPSSHAKRPRRYHSAPARWDDRYVSRQQYSPYPRHAHHPAQQQQPQQPYPHHQRHQPYTRSMSHRVPYRPYIQPLQYAEYSRYHRYRHPQHPRYASAPPSALLGDVQQGLDEFDLFNGELLRDPQEGESEDRERQDFQSDSF